MMQSRVTHLHRQNSKNVELPNAHEPRELRLIFLLSTCLSAQTLQGLQRVQRVALLQSSTTSFATRWNSL
jgi:hypothetical protein